VDELALTLREIAERRRFPEDLLEDLETNGRLVVRRRHQDAAGWRDFEALNSWRVEIGEEQENVVLLVLTPEMLDQAGRPGALLLQPRHLVGVAVRMAVNPVRVLVERLDVAHRGGRKPPNGDAFHAIRTLRVLVLPGHVVARTGREDLHVVVRRQALGDEPTEVLGSAQHFGSVPLNDERELHES
jgi:hypothetical protein